MWRIGWRSVPAFSLPLHMNSIKILFERLSKLLAFLPIDLFIADVLQPDFQFLCNCQIDYAQDIRHTYQRTLPAVSRAPEYHTPSQQLTHCTVRAMTRWRETHSFDSPYSFQRVRRTHFDVDKAEVEVIGKWTVSCENRAINLNSCLNECVENFCATATYFQCWYGISMGISDKPKAQIAMWENFT